MMRECPKPWLQAEKRELGQQSQFAGVRRCLYIAAGRCALAANRLAATPVSASATSGRRITFRRLYTMSMSASSPVSSSVRFLAYALLL